MAEEQDKRNINGSYKWDKVTRNNISYRVGQLETQFTEHDKDNCSKIDKLDERLDAQYSRTGQYYSVITPDELKKTLEVVHKNALDIDSMEGRFNEFTTDRVRRLEVANEKIHVLEDEIRDAENRINAKVDANKIKQQQYVIGIVVGLIMTFIGASVIAFLHI
jgi:hypothetical protein